MSTNLQSDNPAARIAHDLKVNQWTDEAKDAAQEIATRIDFLKERVRATHTKGLVLGISGGVDSTTAGKLCQIAVEQLRAEGYSAKFYAVRLPFYVQRDEEDAQQALRFINPDETLTVDIGQSVDAMMGALSGQHTADEHAIDFVKGNVKARARMIAQYAIAGDKGCLVVGTDHAAEAVMGFFTKFGDGACDLTPLAGLVKGQVRQIALVLGAPADLVVKTPTADLEDLDPGKPDELAYGCTYDEIDNFLLGRPVSAQSAKVIIGAYAKTAHKRALPYAP
ncbi:ammonia-dependent NAD(+) synthetase [Pseudomonas alkylphenolica]|uniref:NH(3)-dependent NAD(+) synthetase n=1 Tax=Pseudomonas alkylphenolica TaxID=237609 RepID=A0A6I6H7L0_9PSED|nr:ammonia-dependent NAD(+) synthetase [Pseudomonas alkylphenolica]QGW78151.1 ammonia-dependent NAD(+) synthetase [Pseudomonas alkylphenolica]